MGCTYINERARLNGGSERITPMRPMRVTRFRTWMLTVLVANLATAALAAAAGVVGDGTPGSCTEAALETALAGGGSVSFNCGPSPVKITLTSRKAISQDTSVDGGGLVSLSGAGASQVFAVTGKHITLSLSNLTIRDGFVSGGQGGAIYNKGTLNVTNSTFFSNSSATDNHGIGGQGGAIFNLGTATTAGTTFLANSVIADNELGEGGAIFNYGSLTSTNDTFSGNTVAATNGGVGFGGAIVSTGRLSVIGSVFSDNTLVAGYGGAIHNLHTLAVKRATFLRNGSASLYDGGAISTFDTASVADSTFADNTATLGGAIGHVNGKLTVTGCTFANNTGTSSGGAIENAEPLTVANSTFFQNGAAIGGGAIFNYGALSVASSTFADNTSANGAGAAIVNIATAAFKNTIITTTTTDESCDTPSPITDKAHNIDSGASCGFNHTHHSLSATDPQLDPARLVDNGGPTQTIAVEAGSPAINAGNAGACRAAPVKGVDQRGFARPGTGSTSCTIGAYEFNSPGPHITAK